MFCIQLTDWNSKWVDICCQNWWGFRSSYNTDGEMYIVIVSIYHTVTFDYKWFCLCITYKWWYACSMNGYTLWYGSAQDIISRNWIWVRVYICTRPKIWGCFLDSTLVYFIFKPLWFGPKKYCRPFSFDFQSLFDLKSKISLVWNLNPFRAKIENF